MANYKGEISGIGNAKTRENEITPDNVAIYRNYVLGYNSKLGDIGGIMDIALHNFYIAPIYITIPSGTKFTFNNRINVIGFYSQDLEVEFICDGIIYKKLSINFLGQLLYNNIVVYRPITGWVDNKYKTIILNSSIKINDKTFNWLKNNSDLSIKKQYNTTVQITDGICFAYGYVGYCIGREITFFPPAVEQYQTIYAEIDRSVIPNKISIKTKNNQSSNKVLINTFRQDILSAIKTGRFQVPLWFVKLSNQGIEELIDIRPLRKYIDRVVYSNNTSYVSGTIAANATVEGDMKQLDTNDKTVATTEWTKAVIEQEIRR